MDYFNILRRRIWLIVGIASTCALLAAVWSYLTHPIYQAQATVVIEQESPGGLERGTNYYHDVSPEYFQTHFELMKSHTVLQRAATKLHLADQPEYRSQSAEERFDARSLLPESVRHLLDPKQAQPKTESEEQLLEAFAGNIEIRPIRGTRLSYVLARSTDPKFAALAANTLASVYIDYSDELTSASKGKSAAWFTSHLDDLRNRVGTAQRSLHEYRSKHGLLGERERQPVTAHNLVELNSEIVKAEVRKAEAQTRYQQIQSVLGKRTRDGSIDLSSLDSLTEVLTSPLIQNLRSREIDASRKVVELSENGPLHPDRRQANSELQFLHSKIQEEVQKVHDSVKREYDIATARERAMRETVGRYKVEKMSQEKQHDIQLSILEREAESSQHLYDIFLKVTKEADVSAGMQSGNVQLATLAVPNSMPVKPKSSLNTMLGLLVGLMTGGATALFLDMRHRCVRGVNDVERYLPDVTILGSVPVETKFISERDMRLPALLQSNLASESFRAIRTSVLLANASELPSSLLITSPGENEGKTTLAVNLAIAISQLRDTRVVLINADLRTAKTHPIFRQDNGDNKPTGLVHFLLGSADLEEILHPTDLPNLWVIPRGFCPSNPSELLHSKQMRELIRRYQVQGYYVMIDTSPTLLVTDPVVLASQVDGVLLVISAGQTRHEDCQTSLHRLEASGGKILGVVLQRAKVTDLPYYSYPSRYTWTGDHGEHRASHQSRAS